MAEEALPHKLQLSDRSKLTMTGVSEVVRFEETVVVLRTTLGMLEIHGQELKLKTLSPEGGQMMVEGQVEAMLYAQSRQQGGWLSRFFG